MGERVDVPRERPLGTAPRGGTSGRALGAHVAFPRLRCHNAVHRATGSWNFPSRLTIVETWVDWYAASVETASLSLTTWAPGGGKNTDDTCLERTRFWGNF